ncbi:solute carrier family 22 member 13-like [Amblyomma americanum]
MDELHRFLPEVTEQTTVFRCRGANETLHENPCLEPGGNASCASFEFDVADRSTSIVTEWELVCRRDWLLDAASSAYTIGSIVGIIMAAPLCDRLGRRYSLLISLLTLAAVGLALPTISSPAAYIALRFSVALCVTPVALVSYVLVSEMVTARDLAVYCMAMQLGYSVGSLALGWLYRAKTGWRLVTLTAMAPVALLIFQFGFTTESPRWLLRVREYNRAQRVLLAAARKNGLNPITALNLWTRTRAKLESLDDGDRTIMSRPLYWLLWATWRWTTLILLTTWFTNGFVYYSVVISYIRVTNIIFNFDVRGAWGPPTLVLAYLLVETLGRRSSVALALSATGLMAILVSFLAHLPDLMTVLSLVGLSSITVASAQLPLLTLEQYPTPLRAPSISCGLLAGQLGALAAPFVRKQAMLTGGEYGPLFVLGVTSLTCGWLLLALPETKFEGLAAHERGDLSGLTVVSLGE